MNVDDHIAQLRTHGDALADAAKSAGAGANVPTCPDWAVRDLVAHQGMVHRWACSYVATGRMDPPGKDDDFATAPDDDALLDWFRAGHQELVDTLSTAPDSLECWSFLPAPSPRAFWARRQAHETAIHRVDAESAAGISSAFDPAFAVDGIDELLLGFYSRRGGRLVADSPLTLGVRATDTEDAWSVRIGPEGRDVTRGDATGDCVISGPADDLYRLLWNRRDLNGVDVTGDTNVWDLWQAKARITWG